MFSDVLGFLTFRCYKQTNNGMMMSAYFYFQYTLNIDINIR